MVNKVSVKNQFSLSIRQILSDFVGYENNENPYSPFGWYIMSIPFVHMSFSCDGKRGYMLRAVKIIIVAFIISVYISITL